MLRVTIRKLLLLTQFNKESSLRVILEILNKKFFIFLQTYFPLFLFLIVTFDIVYTVERIVIKIIFNRYYRTGESFILK